jgi:hypothetical protein
VDIQVIEEQPPDWQAYGTVPIGLSPAPMIFAWEVDRVAP